MSFLSEVREEAGPQLCKIGNFIAKQDSKALKKVGKDPLTEEELSKAKEHFPTAAVLSALRKRGLTVSEDVLRKHVTKACACQTEELIS